MTNIILTLLLVLINISYTNTQPSNASSNESNTINKNSQDKNSTNPKFNIVFTKDKKQESNIEDKFTGSRLTNEQIQLVKNKLKSRETIENHIGEPIFEIKNSSYYIYEQKIQRLFMVNASIMHIIKIDYDNLGNKTNFTMKTRNIQTIKLPKHPITYPQIQQDLNYLDRLTTKLKTSMQ
ncbi:MAG: hypothetical protein AAFO15_00815 [Pseudomonadota bacterium]